jgi:hypothetical protein
MAITKERAVESFLIPLVCLAKLNKMTAVLLAQKRHSFAHFEQGCVWGMFWR